MRLFVATDIHGSAYWAERIVEEFKFTRCDTLILLGDVYNHGPRNPFPRDYAPMKVAELFNEISDKVIAVKGNCDSEVDEMISEFPFVKEKVVEYNGRRFYFTHGHVHNKDNVPPDLTKDDMLFYGHFHKNEVADVDGVICVNVSSASLPKDRPTYCIVDDGDLEIYYLDEKDYDGSAKMLGFITFSEDGKSKFRGV